MYETIHSLIVADGKGGAREIAPGQPYTCDAKEADRLLRIGAIKAVDEKPAEVADKAPAGKQRRSKKDEAPAAPAAPEGDEPDFG